MLSFRLSSFLFNFSDQRQERSWIVSEIDISEIRMHITERVERIYLIYDDYFDEFYC